MNELDLGTLLNTARRGGEVSYERLSKACGGSPTAKRLHQLENAPLKNFPDPGTIKALANGTGFGVTEIVMACARSLHLPVTSDDPDTFRIYGLSTVPSRITDLFRDLGREIVELNQKQASNGPPQAIPIRSNVHPLRPDGPSARPGKKIHPKMSEPEVTLDELPQNIAARDVGTNDKGGED